MTDTHLTEHPDQRLAGTSWRLDGAGSSAEFSVPHFWGLVAAVKGRFTRLDGRLEIDRSRRWRMELTVDAVSLPDGNRRRDEHLRSADFFDVAHHPEVRFRSTGARDAGDGRLQVAGELEAAGQGAPLELEARVEEVGAVLELQAVESVDQRLLDMTWSPLGMARTPTTLAVHARLIREA